MLSVRVKGTNKAANNIFKTFENLVARVSRDAFIETKSVTPVRSGRAKKAWKMEKKGKFNVELVNRVPYASRLNTGYSKQAPRGITRPASKAVANKYR
jgi:hypothetical protein